MRTHVLFDLDGTLTEPKEGITRSVAYALEHFGIRVTDLDSLCPFIGPPLMDSFQEYYHFSEEEAKQAVVYYREYFSDQGWRQNRVFPGIREMLAELKAQGAHLFVATSKPEVFAKRILDHFELTEYFDWIGGAELHGSRIRKADVIRWVLEQTEIGRLQIPAEQILMVGDREHDVLGAKECGLDCLGVLFGYGSRQELDKAGAIGAATSVEELTAMLKRECGFH